MLRVIETNNFSKGFSTPPMQRELGFSIIQMGNMYTAFSVGLTVGAFFC